jgi:hypothetical protein
VSSSPSGASLVHAALVPAHNAAFIGLLDAGLRLEEPLHGARRTAHPTRLAAPTHATAAACALPAPLPVTISRTRSAFDGVGRFCQGEPSSRLSTRVVTRAGQFFLRQRGEIAVFPFAGELLQFCFVGASLFFRQVPGVVVIEGGAWSGVPFSGAVSRPSDGIAGLVGAAGAARGRMVSEHRAAWGVLRGEGVAGTPLPGGPARENALVSLYSNPGVIWRGRREQVEVERRDDP